MLTVITPGPYFLPEYQYVVSVVLREFLGVEAAVVAGDDPHHWLIGCDHRELELPNLFFPEQNPDSFFDAARIPHTACQARSASDATSYAALFGVPEKDDAGLDIFGTIFFLLTSFEDHLALPRDEHNRLRHDTCWTGRNTLLHRPVVEELLELLSALLCRDGMHIPMRRQPYALRYTCDIDHPTLCYKAAPHTLLRGLAASLLKRRSLSETVNRLRAIGDVKFDPYNTVPGICAYLERRNIVGSFFVKSGTGGSAYDDVFSLTAPHIQEIFAVVRQRGHTAGFHPGYATADAPGKFLQELRHVRESCPMPLHGGRQHYLLFRGARTWRMWAEAGLGYDSSLGFSAMPGFRCGTAREFPVFDLERRVRLPLAERPLLAMEVSLLGHMGLSHDEAFDVIKNLGKTVKHYGGNMTLLWHNHTLTTKKNRELFAQTLNALA